MHNYSFEDFGQSVKKFNINFVCLESWCYVATYSCIIMIGVSVCMYMHSVYMCVCCACFFQSFSAQEQSSRQGGHNILHLLQQHPVPVSCAAAILVLQIIPPCYVS